MLELIVETFCDADSDEGRVNGSRAERACGPSPRREPSYFRSSGPHVIRLMFAATVIRASPCAASIEHRTPHPLLAKVARIGRRVPQLQLT